MKESNFIYKPNTVYYTTYRGGQFLVMTNYPSIGYIKDLLTGMQTDSKDTVVLWWIRAGTKIIYTIRVVIFPDGSRWDCKNGWTDEPVYLKKSDFNFHNLPYEVKNELRELLSPEKHSNDDTLEMEVPDFSRYQGVDLDLTTQLCYHLKNTGGWKLAYDAYIGHVIAHEGMAVQLAVNSLFDVSLTESPVGIRKFNLLQKVRIWLAYKRWNSKPLELLKN